jgi:hypothetical protein
MEGLSSPNASPNAATHDNAQAEPAVPSLARGGTRAGSIEARRYVRPVG